MKFCLFVMILAMNIVVYADRGSIPFYPGIKIFEPTQRAIIAWSGTQELLILSTDLTAEKNVKILEVMAFPSEPSVKEGEIDVFRRAARVLNRKLFLEMAGMRRGGDTRGGRGEPAGEVTFHEQIGAHDISVTRVIDGKRFIDWVNGYLKSQGVDTPQVPVPLKKVVDEYIAEGFHWFVFDVVEVGDGYRTLDAIEYQFKTDFLYYPMKITRTESGQTSAEFFVFTPKMLTKFPGIPIEEVKMQHKPVELNHEEMRYIHEGVSDMMKRYSSLKMRIWKITGELSGFKGDLIGY